MVKPSSAVALTSLILVCGCSNSRLSESRPESPPSTTAQEQKATASNGRGNRVSEMPWWQQETIRSPTPSPAVDPEPVHATFELSSDVLFDIGSAELGTAAASQLNHLARLAQQHPAARLEIVGYTDSTPGPTANYNDDLSLERAESVRDWLVEAGTSPERITTGGSGASNPVASNETEAGRAANRRVTITVDESDG